MIKRFARVDGLHNIFDTGETGYDVAVLSDRVDSGLVNEQSILFITADEDDFDFNEKYFGTYIWTNGVLFPCKETNDIIDVVEGINEDIVDINSAITAINETLIEKQNILSAGRGITIVNDVVNANTSATTVAEIQLSNGAPINALDIWDDNKIPSGTSIQDILTKLLCKEIFPSKATLPKISVDNVGLGIKEFNSTTKDVIAPTPTFSDGNFNATFSSPAQPGISGVSWTNTSVTMTITSGFSSTDTGGTYMVVLGDNSATFSYSGNYSRPNEDCIPITNLSHPTLSTTKITTDWDGSDLTAVWNNGTSNPSATVTATGVYPCFTNISGDTLIVNPTVKCGLTDGTTITLTVPSEVVAGNKFKFAFPSPNNDRSVTFKIWDGLTSSYVNFDADYTTTYEDDFYKGITYTIITTDGEQGKGTYRFILSKNLKS